MPGAFRIGRVDEVLPVGQRQVAPDGARRGLAPVGGTGERPHDLDRLVPGHDHRHQRAAGHELLERRIERLLQVLGVVLVGQRRVHPAQHHRVDGEPLALEPPDHLADQPAAHRVRLDQHQRTLGHRESSLPVHPDAA